MSFFWKGRLGEKPSDLLKHYYAETMREPLFCNCDFDRDLHGAHSDAKHAGARRHGLLIWHSPEFDVTELPGRLSNTSSISPDSSESGFFRIDQSTRRSMNARTGIESTLAAPTNSAIAEACSSLHLAAASVRNLA